MKYRVALIFTILALALSACISLAEDVTPPPNYQSPTPAPTMGPLFPAESPNLAEGAAIYATECAPCHGVAGLGDGEKAAQLPNNVPALGVPDIARRSSPAEWFTTVTQGRIQNFMPPFRSLNDQQRWNVVSYALSLNVKTESLDQGKALYEANCAQCHGDDGAAIASASLADQATMSRISQNDIYGFIANGIAPGMPALGDKLGEAEIFAIADYSRSFTLNFSNAVAAVEPTATPEPATATPEATTIAEGTPAAETTPGDGTPAAETTPAEGETAVPSEEPVATGGIVRGQVVLGDGSPAKAGLAVTLHGYAHGSDNTTAPEEVVTLTAETNDSGEYQFDDVAIAEGQFYLVDLTFSEITYQSDVALGEAANLSLIEFAPLTVYETSEDYSNLTVEQVHVFFNAPVGSQMQVYTLYVFTNNSAKTVVVPVQDTLIIPFIKLPDGISPDAVGYEDAQMGGAFLPYQESGFAIPPSDAQYGIAAFYQIPFDKAGSLTQAFVLDVPNGSALVPEGMTLSGEGLVDGGVQSFQEGQNYQSYTFGPLTGDSSITLEISGEPKQAAVVNNVQTTNNSTQTLIIGIGAFGVVLILAGAWLFMRDRNRIDDDEEDDDESGVDDADAIMDAIIALDDQFKSGNITEAAYKTRRAELKSKLKGKI